MDLEELVDTEEHFWDELDDIVSTPCRTNDRIDDTLRTWLSFITVHRETYLLSEQAIVRCSTALFHSDLFNRNEQYIRHQLVYSLLQEDEAHSLHFVVAFLLLDGQQHEQALALLNTEGAFSRLVHLFRNSVDDNLGLHRQIIELLYEMSRVQQISWNELNAVDDPFLIYLFEIIEGLSNDVYDPYHSPVIRAILVLNEQYMVCAHDPNDKRNLGAGANITNRVIKTLSIHGAIFRTFGESIILLLNRESETSLQLLILKFLYLVFTTPSTCEFFYTNDLYVLTDILIRNLLDLPSDTPATAPLRHTYLRVLHPLLAYTQLRHSPHYKREELRSMLSMLMDAGSGSNGRHFEAPDPTTARLATRCLGVAWLKDEMQIPKISIQVDSAEAVDDLPTVDAPGEGSRLVAHKALGISLPEAQDSNVTVIEVTSQSEKPGVITPSRANKPSRWKHQKSPFEDG
ncbi:MAG: hypothetical protein M1828_003806 [Chrysothrix sp. TS-e1954]|nr:MAG: hypothetical protein M1828_003806 [Chrysothrix sp. TS-e1954]